MIPNEISRRRQENAARHARFAGKVPRKAEEPSRETVRMRFGRVAETGRQPSRFALVQACDYRLDLDGEPPRGCGCRSEVPSVCLAGISPWDGHPGLARLYDCLKCMRG